MKIPAILFIALTAVAVSACDKKTLPPPAAEVSFQEEGPMSGCMGPTWSNLTPGGLEIRQELRVGEVKCFANTIPTDHLRKVAEAKEKHQQALEEYNNQQRTVR